MSLLALTAALRRLSNDSPDVDRLCEAAEREQCELAAALHDAERLLSTCAFEALLRIGATLSRYSPSLPLTQSLQR